MTNGSNISAALAIALTAVLLLFLLPVLTPAVGALAGWVVGGFFPGTSRAFLDALGMQELAMWQLGAMLGFVGGFFKAVLTQKS